jgi:hypothetical protein
MKNTLNAAILNAALAEGRHVQVTTCTRSTLYAPKHAGWFSEGKDGSLYVRHGRGRVALSIGDRLLVAIRVSLKPGEVAGR